MRKTCEITLNGKIRKKLANIFKQFMTDLQREYENNVESGYHRY